MNDDMLWLLNWFYNHCDGQWEREKGIKISTIDNPGWSLKVDLDKTELKNQPFEIKDDVERSDADWVYCSVEEMVFKGYGGSLNLPEIIQIFREWAEKYQLEEKRTD